MFSFFIIVILLFSLYLLYESGLIALQSKRAMLFTSSINGMKARFAGCTGKITRIVRFKEARTYTIRIQTSVDKGSVFISLSDPEGNKLIECGEEETCVLSPVAGKRHKLCVQMEKASGNYKIEIV